MRTEIQITTARKPWRVVVIDDNPDDRAEIRRLLLCGSDRLYTFAEAETGDAGIQLCRGAGEPPDCLFLAYNPPDMEATEVLAALTDPDGLPICPVVVLTGNEPSEAGRAVLRAGAQDYIGKDWLTPQGLTRVCENAIERWAMAWDLQDREARLRTSETRLRLFIDHAPAAIAMFDRDMRYLAVSRRWREDYGLGELDVIGRCHYDVFSDVPDRWRMVHQQALAGQVVMAAEDRFDRADGSTNWVKWEVRPWRDHAGNVGGIIIFTEDINERKQAEDNLRVTTERFQAAIQASHVVVFNQDRDLRYTWIHNPGLRFTASEIIGKRDGDLFSRAEDVERLESIKRSVMECGIGQRREVPISYEGVTRYYDLMVQPQRNAEGTIIGVTGAGVDITERKEASAALQESEERLRLSLDAAGAGIWEFVPATGEFIASDRALALHGLPPGTPMTHERALAAVWAGDRPRVEAALQHTLKDGKPFAIEVRAPQPDGSIRWLVSRAELRSSSEHPRLVGWVQDFTARKRVESNLAFLAELSEAFAPAATTEQIARIAAQKIIRQFDASRVNFSDVNVTRNQITVFYSQRDTSLKEDRVTYRLSEYLSESLIDELRGGRTLAVSDVRSDPRTSAHAVAYLQWDIGSMMLAPHICKGRWRFLIAAHKAVAYSWRSDEIELLREVATRVYLRLELARAMEALSAAHDTFRHLVENSPFGVFAVDADFHLVQASAGAQRLFENVRPLSGRDFTEIWSILWPEPFASETAGRFRRTLETGEAYRAASTVERRRDTGEVESYDWRIERVVLPDGRCGVVCHFYDLSERQRWEAALVAKEREVRTLTENSPDILSRFDRDLRHVFVNSAIEKATGRSRIEFLGKTNRELGMPAALCDRWEGAIRGVFESGKPTSLEFTSETLDGPRSYSSRLVPEFGPEGSVELVLAVTRDVTEQRQAELDLRASEEKFRTLADNISQLAWMADSSGSIFWYNRRWYEYTGTTFEEMQGCGWRQVHHPDHVDRVARRLQHSWDTGEVWEDTFPLRGKDGEYRWFLSRALPIRDDQGQVVRWFGTNTDVTEQRQLEQALQDADRKKDEFIAMISHEMRNPLSAILSCVAIMRSKGLSESDMDWARDVIDRQSRQLNRIIEDLLDVTRIARGKVQLRCETTTVQDAIKRAAEAVRPILEAKQHNLALILPDSPLRIHADSARLEQIIANLLTNAAKYSDENGNIAVQIDCKEGDVLIRVRDSGIGIPADQLGRIFQMFTQVEDTLDRSRGGLGIGLMLVKSLAEMHGGSVWASSDGPGKGSEFTVRLPLPAASKPLPNTAVT